MRKKSVKKKFFKVKAQKFLDDSNQQLTGLFIMYRVSQVIKAD